MSADDKWLVTSGHDKTARVWETATGKELQVLKGHDSGVSSIALSPDGKLVATGSEDRMIRLWDTATGNLIRQLVGHECSVYGLAFTRDGSKLLSAGSADCSVRLWDVTSGSELCRLVSFKGDEWATFDPERRYDSADGGDVSGLHWVVGNETRPLSRFRRQFYVRRLFPKHLGTDSQTPRPVGDAK